MKKAWKDLEGSLVRIDVGSTSKEALSDSIAPQLICFTTDGKIVFNGIEYPNMSSLVKGPYIMQYVGEGSSYNKLPQILLDGTEADEDALSTFLDTYPIEEIVNAAECGRTIVCKVNKSKHPAQIEEKIYLEVVDTYKDVRPTWTKMGITFRWMYGGSEYITEVSLTQYSDSTSNVSSIVRRRIDTDSLREELEQLKALLTLTTTN